MSRKRLAKKTAGRPQSRPDGPESAAIAEATRRLEIRKPRLVAICEQSSAGRVQTLGPDHDDQAGWLARLQDAFGTHGTAFAIAQLNKLIASSRTADGKIEHVKLNSMLAMIEGAAPANEIQAALAVQMAVVHAVVLHVLLRASTVDQVPQFDSASNSAVKLLRTFAMQAETLAKLQRGGEQVVKVVHVHPGAQAIVGNVVRGQHGLRGGVDDEKGCQPHAKAELPAASLVPVFEVRSTDAQRQPCRSPSVKGKRRCRMHGGAIGSGAPSGDRNGAYRSGDHTREAVADRRMISALVAEFRALAKSIA